MSNVLGVWHTNYMDRVGRTWLAPSAAETKVFASDQQGSPFNSHSLESSQSFNSLMSDAKGLEGTVSPATIKGVTIGLRNIVS